MSRFGVEPGGGFGLPWGEVPVDLEFVAGGDVGEEEVLVSGGAGFVVSFGVALDEWVGEGFEGLVADLFEDGACVAELGGSGEVDGLLPGEVGAVDDGVGSFVVELPDVVAAIGVSAGAGEDGGVDIGADALVVESFLGGLPAFEHEGVVFVGGFEFEEGSGPGPLSLDVGEAV